MATVKLQQQLLQIKEDFFRRNRIAEDCRNEENTAAIKIQSWFRGCLVRAHFRDLHRKATIVQKVWRGYTARGCFRQMLKIAYFRMKMNFYNAMAVRIQKRWRGYYVRRYIHNCHARQQYLDGLARKNERVRRDLQEFEEQERRARERLVLEREEQDRQEKAQMMHYLLSTEQCPGVFNSPFRGRPHDMELRMRSAKPLLVRAVLQKSSLKRIPDPSIPEGSRDVHETRPLPPISRKPQGPFREPAEVHQLRRRPLEPTLRVATSFTALEDARKDLLRLNWTDRFSTRPRITESPLAQFS